jgi:lambda family phage portal protein
VRAVALAKARKRASVRARQRSAEAFFFGGGAYEGARSDLRETTGWQPGLGSADQDSLGDLPALRARTRDLERNTPLATGAILTRLDNVVGTGLMPTAQIDRDYLGLSEDEALAWEQQAQRVFETVALSPSFDVAGRLPFPGMQRMALRSVLSGGDAFGLRRWCPRPGDVLALKIQLLEADRCANPTGKWNGPNLRDGVQLDRYGAATGYWFTNRHPHEHFGAETLQHEFVPAIGKVTGQPQVLHILEQMRLNQTRGIPYLAPVILPLKQIGRFTDSHLAAAVLSSFFSVLLEDAELSSLGGPGIGDLEGGAPIQKMADSDVTLGRGTIIELPKGKKASFANPATPNAQFDPFVSAIAQYTGVALGIPAEVLLKRFNSNYSASRAALQEAWRAFEQQQYWLVSSFCQPIYNWVIAEAVLRGLLIAPGFFENPMVRRAYCGAMWDGPVVTQLDPLKEVNAAIRKIEHGLSTRATESPTMSGQSWEKNHKQLVRETAWRKRDGLTADTSPATQAQVEEDEDEQPVSTTVQGKEASHAA